MIILPSLSGPQLRQNLKRVSSGSPKELIGSIPEDVKPLMGGYYTLDDVYLHYLGDELAEADHA